RAVAARGPARPLPDRGTATTGLDFHRSLAAAAGNRFLTAALTPIWAQVERVAHLHPAVAGCGEDSADHAVVIRALAAGDGAAAALTLRGHLDAWHAEVAEWGTLQQRVAS